MLALLVLVGGIGLADSINPSTVAPAALLATGRAPRKAVAEFALGVFAVSFIPGAVVAVGPGQLLVSHAHGPRPAVVHVIELVAGGLALLSALGLWFLRGRVAAALERPPRPRRRRSAFALGAGIMGAELPTAFPYFAALAAIVASGRGLPERMVLVVFYNLMFVAPLLGIAVALTVAGDRARPALERVNRWLRANAAVVAGALLAVFGAVLLAIGAVGLVA